MNSILDAIGNTPIIKLEKISPENVEIWAKAEFLNPSGSIKDRIARYMIETAEKRGLLKKGMTIVEPTSGNTGIALAFISAIKGYNFIAVMPSFVSKERIKIMKHYGAKIILTPASKGMKGAVEAARKIARKLEAYMPNQFENVDNVIAHEKTTGTEILEQMDRDLDAFVTGVGTGGTLIGVAKVLRKYLQNVKIVAVEPKGMSVLSRKNLKRSKHKIEGIGEGFVPKIIKPWLYLIDKVIEVNDEDAIRMAKTLAKKEGLFVGI